LLGPIESLEEPPLLLLLRYVQEELEHHDAVAHEMFFAGADVLVARFPERLAALTGRELLRVEQLRMDLHDEDVLVVGAVEDADPSPLRQALHVAPEEVVAEFFGGGFLEAEDLATLRVHAGHDMLDRAVLAGRIHGLEDNEDAVTAIGIKQLLRL